MIDMNISVHIFLLHHFEKAQLQNGVILKLCELLQIDSRGYVLLRTTLQYYNSENNSVQF